MIKSGFDALMDILPDSKSSAKNVILLKAVDLIKRLEAENDYLQHTIAQRKLSSSVRFDCR